MKKTSTLIVLLIIAMASLAQQQVKPPLTRVLFIVDASTSMKEKWQGSEKFSLARQLLSELLDSLSNTDSYEYMEFALRLYGHQSPVPPEDCTDTKLEIPFSKNNKDAIKKRMMEIEPKGTTPIAYTLEECASDFPVDTKCRNIIILITDGLERCNGDPCAISMALQKKGITLRPYVIGIKLNVDIADILDCVGNYYDVKEISQFKAAINEVINQVTHMTSVQVNLLDSNGKAIETDVVMSFHDNMSGAIRYNYLHTLNKTGTPDTVYLDVLSTYNLKVHTIPPVYLDTIVLSENTHNIIELDAPQGILKVNVKGNDPRDTKINCIVRKSGMLETLFILNANKKQKFLLGLYDIEILTTPRIYKYAIEIDQSKETVIQIDEPGDAIINFQTPAYGSLMLENGDLLTNLFDFRPEVKHYEFRLQPGYYRIVYREKQHFKTSNSSEAAFRVKSGETEIINL